MSRMAIGAARLSVIVFSLLCVLPFESIHAQPGLPRPTPNAKACAYLPVADLEAHFGTKAENILGLDQSTRNTCNARFGDPFHAVAVESHPPSPADQAMTAAERLTVVKQAMKGVQDTRDFGSIGCFRTTIDMGK